MSIIRKVRAVERLFGHLEVEIAELKSTSGMYCVAGCGRCCTKPDIEATPLEFLPYALHLFVNGQADEYLERLSNEEEDSICVIYRPFSQENIAAGSCGSYVHRGMICRLFGFAASRNKYGEKQLVTCKTIKESQKEQYEMVNAGIKQGLKIPMFTDYYQKLLRIDMRMGGTYLPVNKAIKVALEEVMSHYAYRPFPKKFRKVA